MLNSLSLNSNAINAPSSPANIGAGTLISIDQQVVSVNAGTLVSVEQSVGLIGSGNVLSVWQNVIQATVATGALINIAQQVVTPFEGTIIPVAQIVRDAAQLDRLTTTGWNVIIVLAGQQIPDNQIHGQVRVERSEGQAAIAEFTLIPMVGAQDYASFAGKSVEISVQVPNGLKRVYTGVVDIPVIDLIEKKITFKCTDRREELINAQLGSAVSNIGYYSSLIFQDVKDTADELEKRLSTTPYSVDFNVFGTYTLTPWLPKAVPDYTFNDADVYYRDPSVELSSRSRVVNKVNISFEYRFERLHHMQRHFSWHSPMERDVLLLVQYSASMTYRNMVAQAIEAAGWPIRGTVTYTPIWPSGWYGGRAWSTVAFKGTTVPKLDSNGSPILDASGNPTYTTTNSSGTDLGPLYCMGAEWDATTRWSQSIVERYSFTVGSSQSQAQYGVVEQDETYACSADYDSSVWENYKSYTNPTGTDQITYYINQDVNRADMRNAVNCALNKARTSILATHRDTKVNVTSFIRPELDLVHTLRINTSRLQAKGKIFSIIHTMNVTTGEAMTQTSVSLYKAQGSSTDSSLYVPPMANDTAQPGTGDIRLDSHYGENPEQAGAEKWTGMIGNRFPVGGLARTSYAERFVVDTPAIPDSVRQEKIKTASQGFNVAIPDDELIITF